MKLAPLLFIIALTLLSCAPTALPKRQNLPELPHTPPPATAPETTATTDSDLTIDAITLPATPERDAAWLRWEHPCDTGRCAGEPVFLSEASYIQDVALIDLAAAPFSYPWGADGELPRSASGFTRPTALVVVAWSTPKMHTSRSTTLHLVELSADGSTPRLLWTLRAAYSNANGSQSIVNSLDFIDDPDSELPAIEFHSNYHGKGSTSSAPVFTERFIFDGQTYTPTMQ